MKVLLAVENVFSSIGGGQRFFSNLIEANPTIEFCFFSSQSQVPGLPSNAHAIPLTDVYRRNADLFDTNDLIFHGEKPLVNKGYDLAYLMDMAASVSAMQFDILDIPDYLPFGVFLKEAMEYHRVSIGKVSLSMHGTLSMGLLDNWDAEISGLESLIKFENIMYRYANIRYGISRRYVNEWSSCSGLLAHLLDPCFEVKNRKIKQSKKANTKEESAPDICFVGRQEKWKGVDLFIEFCSRLPHDAFGNIRLIGPKVEIHGHSSEVELAKLAKNRKLEILTETIPPGQIQEWFETERVIVVTPSRRDTFNLVALESLLAGCPTVISSGCGVCDYLAQVFPEIPYVKFDPENIMVNSAAVINLAADYDQHRVALRNYLDTNNPMPGYGVPLRQIYGDVGTVDAVVREGVRDIFSAYLGVINKGSQVVKEWRASSCSERYNVFFCNRDDAPINGDYARQQFFAACKIQEIENVFFRAPTPLLALDAVDHALDFFKSAIFGGNRANIYRLMASWERLRGNELLYATYMLRVGRLTGRQDAAVTAEIVDILQRCGYKEEAAVVGLLSRSDNEAIYRYMKERANADFSPAPVKFAKKINHLGKPPHC